ncbi:phosphatase PAP2 family protein [Anaeromyxobacter diazotrophicus]|nr:phosphatase PAP2 family protein [Anaeromyxobacter diazotrophicus]
MLPPAPPAMRLVAAAVLSLALAAPACGEDPALRPTYDLAVDGAVTGAAAAGTLTLLALKNTLAPAECRWCTPPGFDGDLARSLAWGNRDLASKGSDVLQVAIGAGALGYAVLDGRRRGDLEAGLANALLITEATSLALLVDESVKYAVGRARPYAWLGGTRTADRDANLSFFSGHTTFAFAVAASTSTLLVEQGAPDAALVSVAAFALAGTTGYLRLAAQQHYLSDVLAGAAVGTAIGWAVPHFFHAPREGGLRLQPAPGGIAFAW